MSEPDPVKIAFRLTPDEDGWPPVAVETMWAKAVDGGYQLENVPFFAARVACDDVVAAAPEHGILTFTHVVRPSGNSTVRAIVFQASEIDSFRRRVGTLGLESELNAAYLLVTIHVPPDADYRRLTTLLREWQQEGRLDWEEPCLRHPDAL
jgi:hypothetical protein